MEAEPKLRCDHILPYPTHIKFCSNAWQYIPWVINPFYITPLTITTNRQNPKGTIIDTTGVKHMKYLGSVCLFWFTPFYFRTQPFNSEHFKSSLLYSTMIPRAIQTHKGFYSITCTEGLKTKKTTKTKTNREVCSCCPLGARLPQICFISRFPCCHTLRGAQADREWEYTARWMKPLWNASKMGRDNR